MFDYWETCLYEHNVENMFEVSEDEDGFYFMDYINKSNLSPKFDILLNKSYELLNSNNPSLIEKGVWLIKKLEKHLKKPV